MEKLTFEQLPEAVALLLDKVNRIEKLLSGGKAAETPLKAMLTINESAAYLGVSLSSMYKRTHWRELPIYKPSGGKVYIKRDDLVTYMTNNRLMSQDEIEKEAINYVIKKSFKKIPINNLS